MNPLAEVESVAALRVVVARCVGSLGELERARGAAESVEHLSMVAELRDVVDALRCAALDRLRVLEAEQVGGAA